ncbi:MAG: Gfo/Idh/MocA family oxidoreductase [Methanomicrobiales archaeon]|nr:Gfo/Idh/MocA family oxidoreductase [Methanomicrobiales archaeon]
MGEPMDILVIGAGSIGRRHAANLAALGVRVAIHDIDREALSSLCTTRGYRPIYDLDHALEDDRYTAAVICTPTHLHIPHAIQAAEAGLHLFIEKPLSHGRQGIDELLSLAGKHRLVGMAGFMLRYEPGLCFLKEHIWPEDVAFAQIEFGSYLPNWRGGVDYRSVYSATRSMGGGIILDDIHELDYACWLFGFPDRIAGRSGKYSDLEIDVEDTAEILLIYPGTLVTIHADYLQRRYVRRCRICMRDGYTTDWIFGEGVTSYTEEGRSDFSYRNSFAINDLYAAEMEDFLRCIRDGRQPESDLPNAAKVLDLALRAQGGRV